jgi:hypothetical protein
MLDKRTNNSIAHSQAHLQFAQANTQPKIAKELVFLLTLTLPAQKKLNLLKTEKTE